MKLSKKSRRLFLTSLFGALAFLSVLLAAGVATAAIYQSRTLPKTYVAGQSVSGQQVSSAQEALNQAADKIKKQKITIVLGKKTVQTTASELGIGVDTSQAESQIANSHDAWHWLTIGYWSDFFTRKNVALAYSIDRQKLEKVIDQKFDITQTPVDASISVANGRLAVNPAKAGEVIDVTPIIQALESFNTTGQVPAVTLRPEISTPIITDEVATQTVNEIKSAIPPVYLKSNGRTFTVGAGDLYGVLSFGTQEKSITWRIDPTKLASYLSATIGKKVNVTMIPKVIQDDANHTVTTNGVDGKQTDSKDLATSIISAIINQTDTKTAPLTVPVATIPFTTRTVNPVYTLGLYPGLYLDVSLSKQKVTIIKGADVIGQYGISSGGWSTPTPTGTLYIFNKISEAYSPDFRLWMPMWNGLATSPDGTGYNGYGMHALVCWDKACNYREGVNHIGEPVSHGCIRVADAGIPWIYNNAPIGTPVVIHN